METFDHIHSPVEARIAAAINRVVQEKAPGVSVMQAVLNECVAIANETLDRMKATQ